MRRFFKTTLWCFNYYSERLIRLLFESCDLNVKSMSCGKTILDIALVNCPNPDEAHFQWSRNVSILALEDISASLSCLELMSIWSYSHFLSLGCLIYRYLYYEWNHLDLYPFAHFHVQSVLQLLPIFKLCGLYMHFKLFSLAFSFLPGVCEHLGLILLNFLCHNFFLPTFLRSR